eukprot:Selendium_serpulae@DN839_c0_g1_i1.p1
MSKDDDYLQHGGVAQSLGVLSQPGKTPAPLRNEELFLSDDYEMKLGQLTWTTGVGYFTGLGMGSVYGLALGLRKGGATPKLAVNSVLNSLTVHSPAAATTCAGISLLYSMLHQFNGWAVNLEGRAAPPVNGLLAGALYKSFAGPRVAARYAVVSSAVFTLADMLQRGDLSSWRGR